MKWGVAATSLIALGLLLGAPAQSAAEFCPATIAGPLRTVGADVRLRLAAISPRSVTGSIRFQTSAGWYAAAFAGVALKPRKVQYTDNGMSFTHDDFLSDEIAVHFPAAAKVLYAYVNQASSQGDTLLDWDREGSVTCEPLGLSPKALAQTAAAVPVRTPLPPGFTSDAKPIETQLSSNCKDPFESVRILKPVLAKYPSILVGGAYTAQPTGTTVVSVAVDRRGGVLDTWLWEASGTGSLDQAALDAAKASTYAPSRAFCLDVPGYYLFRVIF